MWPDVSRTIERQNWSDLIPLLEKTGGHSDEKLERLKTFSTLLLQWNRKVSNLISRNDEERLVARHLRESLEPAAWLAECGARRWLDFGSGGGLPALPLAIIGVGGAWTLVESRRTKTLFLRRAVEQLALGHVDVVLSRLEDLLLDAGHRGAYDGFTSRATMTLGPTLELAAEFVAPGGSAYLWKGSRHGSEMETGVWKDSWEPQGELAIAGGEVVVMRFKRK